jgi:hypothetical protein
MSNFVSRAPQHRLVLVTGIVMVGLSLVGYATVADELRHLGEFAGVSALLIAGLALIGDAYGVMARWFALRWVALGILLGAIAGTAIDATVAGFGVGLVAGIAMAQLRARHR